MRKRCKTKQDHLNFMIEVHGGLYTYDEWFNSDEPFTNKTKIPIKCAEHGIFYQTMNNHKCGAGCPVCYGNNKKSKEQYIEIFNKVHSAKLYSYDEWTVTRFDAHTKIPITCDVHGTFWQSINGHIRGHGCPACKQSKMEASNLERYGRKNYNQAHIPLETLTTVADKQWLYDQHITQSKTISNIADELGVWPIVVHAQLTKHNIPVLHHQNIIGRSTAEKEICAFLDELGVHYETSNRTLIAPKELDIVIESHKVAIEYCGLYWHSTANPRMSPSYHKSKLTASNAAGYRLVTIFEDEWLNSADIVKSKICSILNKSQSPVVYARKTTVVKLSTAQKAAFFDQYHIQGNGPGSISYGLMHNNTLVAAMTFINQQKEWNLNRYATACNVVGGFTKLLAHFKRNHQWSRIISFADLRYSVGHMYETCGFVLEATLPPDYYYVKGNKRIHKFNMRHKQLKVIMGDLYDPNVSESANTKQLGLHKIYNCGLLRYVLTK